MRITFAAVSGSNFNHTLHYRYADIGEVMGYISEKRPNDDIQFHDSLSSEIEWNLLRFVALGCDVLIFFTDVASSAATLRVAGMAKELLPSVKIFVYGKAAVNIPDYFKRWPFNAVHVSGDQEYAVLSYLNYLENGSDPAGVWLMEKTFIKEGEWIAPGEWGYPLLSKLPLMHYRRIAKAKGIPFELSVYASKGCPHKECFYCDAWMHEGLHDRRRNPEILIGWIDRKMYEFGFEYVQMHSTNFCADKEWREYFCHVYRFAKSSFKWTCCTRIDTLENQDIRDISSAGCVRVGFGVENIPFVSDSGLKATVKQMETLAQWVNSAGLTGKAYIMAGMPGQSELDLLHTYMVCHKLGFIPRVSTYTPIRDLREVHVDKLDKLNLSFYDRKSFFPDTEIPYSTILKLVLRIPGIEQWVKARFYFLLEQKRVA